MTPFVFSGKKKITLPLRKYPKTTFLYHHQAQTRASFLSLKASLNQFFRDHRALFTNKKVGIVIPDNTRHYHPKKILPILVRALGKLSSDWEIILSLGMHKALGRDERVDLLGEDFLRENRILQHSLEETRSLGTIQGVHSTLNKRLFTYDILFTLGVVEPHLYAGFSGGIKCVGIGLAGLKTILQTHSVDYLCREGVRVANIRTNPFQQYLWALAKKLEIPVYSLNIINNLKKELACYALGEARKSFTDSVKLAREIYSQKVKDRFDLLLVGCDPPKDGNLYQASRLFNYMLEMRPLVKKGGAICVFANLDNPNKSQAEKNFEHLLKKGRLPGSYPFSKPGEHRAFKVIEASQEATLSIITPNIPKGKFTYLSFFPNHLEALKWAVQHYGQNLNVGIIPLGFSFIPTT